MRLLAFDDFLIDRVYQPLADQCSNRFGRNCFWLARQTAIAALAMYLFFISGATLAMLGDASAWSAASSVAIVTFAIGVLTHLGWSYTTYQAAYLAELRTRELGLNPYRFYWPVRIFPYITLVPAIFVLIMPPDNRTDWCYLGFVLAIHTSVYFNSCRLSPPPLPKKAPKTILVGAEG